MTLDQGFNFLSWVVIFETVTIFVLVAYIIGHI